MSHQPVAQPGSLNAIRGVTVTTPDLDAIERAYSEHLDYKTVERGVISAETAAGWGAPAAAGAAILIMQPQSGAPTYLRFVQQEIPAGYASYRSYGWNAIEIIVQDPDAVHERLKVAPSFKIEGEPHGVDTYPYLRAMQASGPAGEFLYFTRVDPPRPDLPVAESPIDRCFITTMQGPDLPAVLEFYAATFGNKPSPIFQVQQQQVNNAFGFDPEMKHGLAVIGLGDGTKIEADQAPPEAVARQIGSTGLTGGVALVTFECDDFDALVPKMIAPPHVATIAPFVGSRVGVIRGAAGELIELVERV